jgi:PAS domain S-box-containing protein
MNTEDIYRLLRTSHVQAQGIVDTLADPMLVLDESLRVQGASRAFLDLFHVDRDLIIGRTIAELGDGEWDIPELAVLLRQVIPKSAAVIDFEVEHTFRDLGRRVMRLTARKLHHADGRSHSMLLVVVDATERVREEATRELLLGEMHHRMKNLFTVTQALARQIPTEGLSAEEFRDAFLGRFGALADAEQVAFAEKDGARLGALVERILAPYGRESGTVAIEPGPGVDLPAKRISTLGLVLHELATNAAKHGALSVPDGKVHVRWHLAEAKKELVIDWVETNGPRVSPPDRNGYGTRLIEHAITYSLDGRLDRTYAPEGLKARITIPV